MEDEGKGRFVNKVVTSESVSRYSVHDTKLIIPLTIFFLVMLIGISAYQMAKYL